MNERRVALRNGQETANRSMLSVAEDFADDIPAFALTPFELRNKGPKVYNWIEKKFGTQLKSRGKK